METWTEGQNQIAEAGGESLIACTNFKWMALALGSAASRGS
jgi:hypothetical protein